MKRKAALNLMILFFFPLVGHLYAAPLKVNSLIDVVAPPANDDCANATTVTVNQNFLCSVVTPGSLEDATPTTGLSGCPGLPQNANDDVWYKFVATDTTHKIELLNITGSNTDLYYMVFDGGVTGDCNTMTGIFCGGTNPGMPINLTIGNTYFVNVFTNSSASGANTTFNICIGTNGTAPPANDDCANAEAILGASMPYNADYDATTATNNAGFITSSGCIDMNDGVWYTIIGDGGDITLTVTPDSWDAAIAVYEGSCGSFTCVGDNNVGGSGALETIVITSTLNTTYYVNIGYPSGSDDKPEGVFNLAVTSSTLSIEDIVAKGFYYYPNPVENVLKMNANESINQISLYSILGREIKSSSQTGLNAELDMSSLPSGTYFVRVVVGESSGSFKVIRN